MPNKVFNIPANYEFLPLVFDFLKSNFSDQISQIKVFLPNRRSCRELKNIFAAHSASSLLPQIKAISDISYEDFLLLSSVKPTYSLQKEQNIKSEKEIQAIKDTFLIHCSILKKAKDSLDEKFSEKEFINKFKSYFDQYKVQDFSFTPIDRKSVV